MILFDSILGTKCHDCGRRIKGTKFEITPEQSDVARQCLCSACYEVRAASERMERQAAEKRAREADDRWRLSPDRQVETDLQRILDSLQQKPDESSLAELKDFCQHVENHWRGEKIQWRTRLYSESLLTDALGSPIPQARVFISRLLAVSGFINSIPALINLVGAKDDSSLAARSAIVAILERLNRGNSTCPRCGCEVEDLGNATTWRCSKCELAWQPNRAVDPRTFRANRSFQKAPWNRDGLLELLEDVVVASEGASAEQVRGWSTRAKEIAAGRDYLLATFSHA